MTRRWGNTHAFCIALAELCVKMGVKFYYDSPINRLIIKNGTFREVETKTDTFEAENCVVALGSYSPLLLKPLGINLPVYPVKGYSITLPVTNQEAAPQVSLIQDELAYSNLLHTNWAQFNLNQADSI